MYKSQENIESLGVNSTFYNDIKSIIETARNVAIRSVDFQRVLMYWRLGERIFVEEQHGKDRAEYGEYLIHNLAKQLENEFGSGFSYRQLGKSMFAITLKGKKKESDK